MNRLATDMEVDEWSGTILAFSSPIVYIIYALEINPDLPGSFWSSYLQN